MDSKKERTELPSIEDWFFKVGLYDAVRLEDEAARQWQRDMRMFDGKLDAYCFGCNMPNTTFNRTR